MIIPKRQIVRLSKAQRAALYDRIDLRDGLRCQKTGLTVVDRVEHHHRQYLSRLGSDVASNLVTLYGPGNTQGSHGWAHQDDEARLLGYSVPSFVGDVTEVPIRILHPEWGQVWVRLFDDFTIGQMTTRDAAVAMRELGIWREGEAI